MYECKSSDALYHDISSCVTNKITVKSKRTKKKGTKTGSRGGRRTKAEPKKRKRESRKTSYTESSEESVDLDDIDMDSDEHNEPSRKRARKSIHSNHSNNHSTNPYSSNFDPHRRSTLPASVLSNIDLNNGDMMDNTQYVPPALTGILPSIRPGALPRIGHQPPPFASLSKVCCFLYGKTLCLTLCIYTEKQSIEDRKGSACRWWWRSARSYVQLVQISWMGHE